MKYTPVKENGELKAADQIAVLGLFEDLHPTFKVLYKFFSDKHYYFHHGIYMGDNKVVDFSGETKSDAKPRQVDLKDFNTGFDRKLFRVDYEEGETTFPPAKTIRKARELIDKSTWPDFDIVWNNCETMATYLKTGKKLSQQANTAAQRCFNILETGVAGLVASCASGGSI